MGTAMKLKHLAFQYACMHVKVQQMQQKPECMNARTHTRERSHALTHTQTPLTHTLIRSHTTHTQHSYSFEVFISFYFYFVFHFGFWFQFSFR